jgi:hypothetical protein
VAISIARSFLAMSRAWTGQDGRRRTAETIVVALPQRHLKERHAWRIHRRALGAPGVRLTALEESQKLKAEIVSPPVDKTTEGPFRIGSDAASSNEAPTDAWTTEDAKELYLINRWGNGYFDVNADGKLTIAPLQESWRQRASKACTLRS